MLRWAHLVPAYGRVLDLACGYGRHARWFAARHHPVLACDRDPVALASLAAVAGVQTLQADLEDGRPWPFAGVRFDAILVVNYLHRALFGPMLDSLAPGGTLIYETFALGNARYGRPSNPQFLLKPGELYTAVSDRLTVVAFEQGRVNRPKPALIQRLCALRCIDLEFDLEPAVSAVGAR